MRIAQCLHIEVSFFFDGLPRKREGRPGGDLREFPHKAETGPAARRVARVDSAAQDGGGN